MTNCIEIVDVALRDGLQNEPAVRPTLPGMLMKAGPFPRPRAIPAVK